MAIIKHFTELRSWQESRELNKIIYNNVLSNLLIRDDALKSQINRSAGSVMDNIAAGFGRGGTMEFIQFLEYSLGSISEVESQLFGDLNRTYSSGDQYRQLKESIEKITGMIISKTQNLEPKTQNI